MNTIIIILLDESGSMEDSKDEVLKSVNDFITNQKSVKDDNAKLYLLTFNSFVKTLYSGVPLEDIPLLTENDYQPNGFTALYDAIAEGVNQAEKNKNKEDRVICVIITDGEENSSRKTSLTDIKKIITKQEATNEWSFVYIGKDPDSWKINSGTKSNNSVGYDTPDSINHTSNPIINFRKTNLTQSNDIFN